MVGLHNERTQVAAVEFERPVERGELGRIVAECATGERDADPDRGVRAPGGHNLLEERTRLACIPGTQGLGTGLGEGSQLRRR